MKLKFYNGFLENSEAVDVDVMEVVEQYDKDNLYDIYFKAELEANDETYSLRFWKMKIHQAPSKVTMRLKQIERFPVEKDIHGGIKRKRPMKIEKETISKVI